MSCPHCEDSMDICIVGSGHAHIVRIPLISVLGIRSCPHCEDSIDICIVGIRSCPHCEDSIDICIVGSGHAHIVRIPWISVLGIRSCPHCEDSIDICIGDQVYLVAFEEAKDAVASERSIFSKNQDCKRFSRVVVNPCVPIFWGLDMCGDRKLITYIHTHTHKITTATLTAHAQRGLIVVIGR